MIWTTEIIVWASVCGTVMSSQTLPASHLLFLYFRFFSQNAVCIWNLSLAVLSFQFMTPLIYGELHKLWNFSWVFLASCYSSSSYIEIFPHIILSSHTLKCSAANIRHQVSYLYRATGDIIVLHILIFLLNSKNSDSHLQVIFLNFIFLYHMLVAVMCELDTSDPCITPLVCVLIYKI
jgi:hypothetical protein